MSNYFCFRQKNPTIFIHNLIKKHLCFFFKKYELFFLFCFNNTKKWGKKKVKKPFHGLPTITFLLCRDSREGLQAMLDAWAKYQCSQLIDSLLQYHSFILLIDNNIWIPCKISMNIQLYRLQKRCLPTMSFECIHIHTKHILSSALTKSRSCFFP